MWWFVEVWIKAERVVHLGNVLIVLGHLGQIIPERVEHSGMCKQNQEDVEHP